MLVMKKVCVFVLVMLYVISCASFSFAAGANYDALNKIEAYGHHNTFIDSVQKLGDLIVANYKRAFEKKFTITDWEDGKKYTVWDGVWAKDKTIVLGEAAKDKKFFSTYLTTADPKMVFAGGIHVGASTDVLEKFFRATISQISHRPGVVYEPIESDYEGSSFYIFYEDGKITEIHARWGVLSPTNDETEKFIEKVRKQLGFPNSNFQLLED